MLRLFPLAAFLILIGPVAAGLLGVILPAFGYLPVLGRTAFSLNALRELADAPGLGHSVLLSLGAGLAATATSLVIVALFAAGWRGTRLFQRLERLVAPLLSVPHAAAAFGLAFLVSPSGFLFRIVAPFAGWDRPPDLLIVQDRLGLAMTAGLVVKEVPFLFLVALAALPQTRPAETGRVAAALGYGRMLGFLHGTLPALYRQIRLPVFAVLAYATSVVDIALILGPTTPSPLAVRVLQWRSDADLDRQLLAAAGALLQLGVTALALLIWIVGERAGASIARALAGSGWRGRRDGWLRMSAVAPMILSAATILAGIAVLALWSVATAWRFPDILPDAVSSATWARLLPQVIGPLQVSVGLAGASSLVAVTVALGMLEWQNRRPPVSWPGRIRGGSSRVNAGAGDAGSSALATLLYLPLIVPQVAFLFGLQVLLISAGFDGSWTAVLAAHLVFVLPYVLLSLSGPWAHWDPRNGQVAHALGHGSDFVFWRIRLPMLLRPVVTAAALGFAVSIALYLPTLLIGGGRWPTVTTETVALASGGDRRLIGATALVQALLPFLGFALAGLIAALPLRNRRLLAAGHERC